MKAFTPTGRTGMPLRMAQRHSLKWFIAITLGWLVLSFHGSGIAGASLVDGFIAGWTFDETGGVFTDASGNGNHLTAIGNPHGDGGNGVVGGALNLDGVTDAASNPNIPAWGITDAFSVSFWLKLDADPRPTNTFLSFVGQREVNTASGNAGWAIRNAGPGSRGKIWVAFYGNDGAGNNSSRSLQTVDDFLVGTDWIHIVMARTGSLNVVQFTHLYVNGVRVDGTSVGSWPAGVTATRADDEPFVVGKRLSTEAGQTAGQMDELGLWNRLLTEDEVSLLYNHGNGLSMNVIPEPTSLMLLGLGVLGLLRRR